jgi:cytochrome c-type biogenesis protein CcmE
MRKRRVVIALLVIGGALAWVAISGLRNSLVYYRTPTEVVHMGRAAYDQPIRLGGFVDPGSVQHVGSAVHFVISDGTTHMNVIATGTIPTLFRAGQGCVLEGSEHPDGAFYADTVLVKHNGVYQPPASGQTPHSADVSGA